MCPVSPPVLYKVMLRMKEALNLELAGKGGLVYAQFCWVLQHNMSVDLPPYVVSLSLHWSYGLKKWKMEYSECEQLLLEIIPSTSLSILILIEIPLVWNKWQVLPI